MKGTTFFQIYDTRGPLTRRAFQAIKVLDDLFPEFHHKEDKDRQSQHSQTLLQNGSFLATCPFCTQRHQGFRALLELTSVARSPDIYPCDSFFPMHSAVQDSCHEFSSREGEVLCCARLGLSECERWRQVLFLVFF